MKKIYNLICTALVVIAVTACSEEDFSNMLTASDEARQILFAVNTAEVPQTRSYREWGSTNDAKTMGVYGYRNNMSAPITAFVNTRNTYGGEPAKWTYDEPQYWMDYTDYADFDFFAYMPYNANASLTNEGNIWTLSYPVDNMVDCITPAATDTALICKEPKRLPLTGTNPIEFQMDQVYASFTLSFQLFDNMARVRDFKIKSVELYGTGLPRRGTVQRSYTINDGVWSSGYVTWNITPGDKSDIEKLSAINVPSKQSIDAENPLKLEDNKKHEWSLPNDGAFYAIPHASFEPTLLVTYDVFVDGTDVITRKDVKGEIVLNNTNFPLLTLSAGKRTEILVKIMPEYLYVLADEDQKRGVLVIP